MEVISHQGIRMDSNRTTCGLVLEELEKESMIRLVAEHRLFVVATLHNVMGEPWDADAGPSGHPILSQTLCSRHCAVFSADLGFYRRRTSRFSGRQICTV
jgi:hypothetical protein